MFFKLSYMTRDFYGGDAVIKTSDPAKNIAVVLRKRVADDEPPPLEAYDGQIVATCERTLSERLQTEAVSSGVLSTKKEAVSQVFHEVQDCINRTLRLLRWRTCSEGSPNPIRVGTRTFVWSVDGTNWKTVDDALVYAARISQLGSGPTAEDLGFIQKGIIEGLNEPLGHELFREAKANKKSNARSAVVLAVAAAEVGFKQFASQQLPDTSWLLELPTPPLIEMLKKFPWSQPKFRISNQVPSVPERLLTELKKAVELRNKIVHTGLANLDYDPLESIFATVRDLLYFLDALATKDQDWALRFVSPEVTSQFKQQKGS